MSSSDEDDDFAPEEFRIRGATEVGVLGLNCLRRIERWRFNSRSLNGEVSGKMKKKLVEATEVVNTLILKAEASGDPDTTNARNRQLMVEVEKRKLEEVRRNKEVGELKVLVEALKIEVLELKDKLDEVEQEREGRRGRWRLAMSKARKKGS